MIFGELGSMPLSGRGIPRSVPSYIVNPELALPLRCQRTLLGQTRIYSWPLLLPLAAFFKRLGSLVSVGIHVASLVPVL
jgi:hypothetical protein